MRFIPAPTSLLAQAPRIVNTITTRWLITTNAIQLVQRNNLVISLVLIWTFGKRERGQYLCTWSRNILISFLWWHFNQLPMGRQRHTLRKIHVIRSTHVRYKINLYTFLLTRDWFLLRVIWLFIFFIFAVRDGTCTGQTIGIVFCIYSLGGWWFLRNIECCNQSWIYINLN